jgi:hypothetical protein
VEVDPRGGRTAPDPVRAGDPKWCGGFPPPLRLSDRSEGDVRERVRSQRTSSCVPPASFHLLYTRSTIELHNYQLVGASDQDVRSNRSETQSHSVGRPLESIQTEVLKERANSPAGPMKQQRKAGGGACMQRRSAAEEAKPPRARREKNPNNSCPFRSDTRPHQSSLFPLLL